MRRARSSAACGNAGSARDPLLRQTGAFPPQEPRPHLQRLPWGICKLPQRPGASLLAPKRVFWGGAAQDGEHPVNPAGHRDHNVVWRCRAFRQRLSGCRKHWEGDCETSVYSAAAGCGVLLTATGQLSGVCDCDSKPFRLKIAGVLKCSQHRAFERWNLWSCR